MKTIIVSWRVMHIRSALIQVPDEATPEEITENAVQAAKTRSAVLGQEPRAVAFDDALEAIEAVHWKTEDGKQFGGRL